MENPSGFWETVGAYLLAPILGMVFTVLVLLSYFWEIWRLSERFGRNEDRSTDTDALKGDFGL
ncbi:MAG: hypothetical protein IJK98_05370 [Clostridia bacterium]|nr:hypothetical protein [Clostridia bacterium]